MRWPIFALVFITTSSVWAQIPEDWKPLKTTTPKSPDKLSLNFNSQNLSVSSDDYLRQIVTKDPAVAESSKEVANYDTATAAEADKLYGLAPSKLCVDLNSKRIDGIQFYNFLERHLLVLLRDYSATTDYLSVIEESCKNVVAVFDCAEEVNVKLLAFLSYRRHQLVVEQLRKTVKAPVGKQINRQSFVLGLRSATIRDFWKRMLLIEELRIEIEEKANLSQFHPLLKTFAKEKLKTFFDYTELVKWEVEVTKLELRVLERMKPVTAEEIPTLLPSSVPKIEAIRALKTKLRSSKTEAEALAALNGERNIIGKIVFEIDYPVLRNINAPVDSFLKN
jgi:hypothetical protein